MKKEITTTVSQHPPKAFSKGILVLMTLFLFVLQACQEDGLSDVINQSSFPQLLSDYHIYEGDMIDLKSSNNFHLYELGSTLFTDNAEKQRLIYLPEGTKMENLGDDLPEFPEEAILVKTFFYYLDKRDLSLGKRVIETRLLVRENGCWSIADYLWNDEQTDAQLLTSGYNTTVNVIDENGTPQIIAYHVPNNRECATCHYQNKENIPIGSKLRNLNISIERNNQTVNQLAYLQEINLLRSSPDLNTH